MADGTYEHSTLQTVASQLAYDLGDPSQTHFTATELEAALRESYQVWNLLTGWERTSATFLTTPGTAWYNLRTEFPTELGQTVTDRSILTSMQYRLMEPIDPETGVGMSDQFTISEFIRSLQQCRDQFLSETQCEVNRRTEVFVPSGQQRQLLPDTIIRVVRAAWRTQEGTRHPLRGTDEFSLSAIPRSGGRLPRTYSVSGTPNLSLDLYPAPENSGYLELFTIETGPTLDPSANTSTGTVLGIPDDLCWGLGFGALNLLLTKNGIASDPQRAMVASTLYSLCREMAVSLPTVLDIKLLGRSIRTESIHVLDQTNYGWEGRNRGLPRVTGFIGDWLALSPVPDTAYPVTISMIRKASLPSSPTDYLTIGREFLPALLGWARQLCLFKTGGAPLRSGIQAAGRLVEQARTYNDNRISQSQYLIEMLSQVTDAFVPLPRAARPETDVEDPRDTASSRSRRSRKLTYQPGRKRLGEIG